jgi:restriction system protein
LAKEPPAELTIPKHKPTKEDFRISPPGSIRGLFPGVQKKYQEDVKSMEDLYIKTLQDYEQAERNRLEKLDLFIKARDIEIEKLRSEHDGKKAAFEAKVKQREGEVKDFSEDYFRGDRDAVEAYITMVLERSEYPDDFPQQFKVAYIPEAKEVVIDYELPGIGVIPIISEYKYVKSRDEIEEKQMKQSDIKALYQDIVSSVTLRTVHEITESDQGDHAAIIVFNGHVSTVDPSTGKDVRPCLISLSANKTKLEEIDIIEFTMTDRRFVEQGDMLSGLDARPNLMDLNPFEFENLVSNLFSKMGLETKLTRSSKDGGVDAVAFDVRPVLGGKVVIQAKRYKNVVGVSAVRDLYGTMLNEGANKGILVTTSNYGPDAFEFSKDKPIELIDGGGLLYLLEKVGFEARIIFPQET